MIGSLKGTWPAFVTPIGGIAIPMINKTGAASVKGNVVEPSRNHDNSVQLIRQDIPDPIGVFLNSGIADGDLAYVVIAGVAEVYYTGNTVRGYFARGFLTADVGFVAGQALAEALPTSPFADDKHFYEIGHVLESITGPGLAKTVIHFN